MKANRPAFPLRFPSQSRHLLAGLAAITLAIVGGCSEKRVVPSPSPTPAPRPQPPAPPPPPATEWRQAPQTPGDWAYAADATGSQARFAGGRLVLRCNRAAATVSIEQPATATGAVPMTIQTTALRRTLTATARDGSAVLAATLPAVDPLLDAMTFSRGRFAVETPGLAPLYVPSWPEVGRVVQDCR